MNFSFGILTKYENGNQLQEVFDSIHNLKIPNYEIVVVGGEKRENKDNIKYILFDENQKNGWVTKKKNVISRNSSYDNLVLMHDYFVFDENWYKNFLEFGDDWDLSSCAQHLINGKRHFTDWVTWDSPFFPRYTTLNYDDWSHTMYMYQSGGFLVAKTKLILENPFNENLTWGQADDVEWSLRVRNKCKWVCNGKSIVKHNKVHRDAK
jgi:hypothetical protein